MQLQRSGRVNIPFAGWINDQNTGAIMVRFAVLSTIYVVSIAAFFAAYASLPVSAGSGGYVPAESTVTASLALR
jgi:hypothetical protein